MPIMLTNASKRGEKSTWILWRLWHSYRWWWLLVSVAVESRYCAVALRRLWWCWYIYVHCRLADEDWKTGLGPTVLASIQLLLEASEHVERESLAAPPDV